MKEIRLTKRIVLGIQLAVQTGIHIGGTKDIYGIGGVDSPVIKDPLTKQPIIPGSSLKGKLRSLLELAGVEKNHVMFSGNETGPTRLIFRDLLLNFDSVKECQSKLGESTFTEIKAENMIDQFTGSAKKGALRFIERVPAGVSFEGEIIVNSYNHEPIERFVEILKKGFELLEHNYLGGSGTRGYGKVNIQVLKEEVL